MNHEDTIIHIKSEEWTKEERNRKSQGACFQGKSNWNWVY